MFNKSMALALPEAKAPPALSNDLSYAIDNFEPMALIKRSIPAPTIHEARDALAALSQYHAPAQPALIELWLRKLRTGTAPIAEEDFEARLEALLAAAADFPAWVWSFETLRTGWRNWKFFPTAAEIYELLAPIVWRGQRPFAVLKQIAGCQLPTSDEAESDVMGARDNTLALFPSRRGM